MDGNRRWAKSRRLPTLAGHKRGQEVFQDCVRFVRDRNIPHAIFYAFSTENWQREKYEVDYLMSLFEDVLKKVLKETEENKVKIKIIGRRSDFSLSLQKIMDQVEAKSRKYKSTTIWVALSYGGRAELIDAVNKAVESGKKVSEENFKQLLWTAKMPDPDMIIRTGGEQRLSNFLPWQSTYSELYFIDKLWPALTKDDFEDILIEYEKRERRRGK